MCLGNSNGSETGQYEAEYDNMAKSPRAPAQAQGSAGGSAILCFSRHFLSPSPPWARRTHNSSATRPPRQTARRNPPSTPSTASLRDGGRGVSGRPGTGLRVLLLLLGEVRRAHLVMAVQCRDGSGGCVTQCPEGLCVAPVPACLELRPSP